MARCSLATWLRRTWSKENSCSSSPRMRTSRTTATGVCDVPATSATMSTSGRPPDASGRGSWLGPMPAAHHEAYANTSSAAALGSRLLTRTKQLSRPPPSAITCSTTSRPGSERAACSCCSRRKSVAIALRVSASTSGEGLLLSPPTMTVWSRATHWLPLTRLHCKFAEDRCLPPFEPRPHMADN